MPRQEPKLATIVEAVISPALEPHHLRHRFSSTVLTESRP